MMYCIEMLTVVYCIEMLTVMYCMGDVDGEGLIEKY